jgi:L-alanine-DL-glutamate epimerase-like enolase superfamily enzyme
MFYRLVASGSELKDGFYAVPSGAGFGLELDADTIRKYRV